MTAATAGVGAGCPAPDAACVVCSLQLVSSVLDARALADAGISPIMSDLVPAWFGTRAGIRALRLGCLAGSARDESWRVLGTPTGRTQWNSPGIGEATGCCSVRLALLVGLGRTAALRSLGPIGG